LFANSVFSNVALSRRLDFWRAFEGDAVPFVDVKTNFKFASLADENRASPTYALLFQQLDFRRVF
jgi:hypothetical protein